MGGLFDYLDCGGAEPGPVPLQPVDNLLLSTLSYAPLDHLVDREGTALWAAAERWEDGGAASGRRGRSGAGGSFGRRCSASSGPWPGRPGSPA